MMQSKKRSMKTDTSRILVQILVRISLKLCQMRANLITRMSRSTLIKLTIISSSFLPLKKKILSIKSTMDSRTMRASNMLNLSLMQSLPPKPISLKTISIKKATVKTMSKVPSTRRFYFDQSYVYRARVSELQKINRQIEKLKTVLTIIPQKKPQMQLLFALTSYGVKSEFSSSSIYGLIITSC